MPKLPKYLVNSISNATGIVSMLICLTYRPRPCSNGPAFVFMCHTLRFCAMSFVIWYSFMSYLMLSSHLFLGLPLLLFPCTCMFNIFLVVSSPSFLPLQQCMQVYTPARSLRSACSYTLVANRSRTVAGDCTFVHAAATVWNALPVSVTSKDSLLSFKAALKTHLCALAYT